MTFGEDLSFKHTNGTLVALICTRLHPCRFASLKAPPPTLRRRLLQYSLLTSTTSFPPTAVASKFEAEYRRFRALLFPRQQLQRRR